MQKYDVVVVGGGCGGLAVAGRIRRQRPEMTVAVIEPASDHYYQPAWTLVGAGAYSAEATRKAEASVMPKGVNWIKTRVTGFEPGSDIVALEDDSRVEYRALVAAAGIQLNWGAIEGLPDTLGRNGVTSNYDYKLAPYTWECIRNYRGEGPALFTQPPMPIKCPGAPQKIVYLAADRFRQRGLKADVQFFNAGPSMFGVPFFAKALEKVIDSWGAKRNFGHNLVAVNGESKEATFEVTELEGKRRVTHKFEMLHVVPPQSAPDFIRNSPLAGDVGWVTVDKNTMRHTQFENVFGLGDCTNTPNSKTAAAIKNQAPVVVANLLRALEGKGEERRYDGYASCPLTTSLGKVMLAEFCYDGVVTPSFFLDPRVPRKAFWWLKKSFLPQLYWNFIIPGRDWPIVHKKRDYAEAVPQFTP